MPDTEHKLELIRKYQQNLQLLEERRAEYGVDVPQHILHEIKQISQELERLQEELKRLAGDQTTDAPLPAGEVKKKKRKGK